MRSSKVQVAGAHVWLVQAPAVVMWAGLAGVGHDSVSNWMGIDVRSLLGLGTLLFRVQYSRLERGRANCGYEWP